MEHVLLDMDHITDIPFMYIRNLGDLADYMAATSKDLEKTIHKAMCSNVPVDRWGHLFCSKDLGDSAAITAWLLCTYDSGKPRSPLLEIDVVINKKFKVMADILARGDEILANYNGGYCTWVDSYTNMRPDTNYVPRINYKIADKASYINLENDPVLEQHTKDWFYRKSAALSYVVNLRDMIGDDLVKVFNQFKINGGHTVYVYTTGIDVQEMYDYSDNIIESGIKNVIFEFNSGINDDILTVIDYLKGNDINVEYSEIK